LDAGDGSACTSTIGCPGRLNPIASTTFVSAGPLSGTKIPNFLEMAVFSGFVNLLSSMYKQKVFKREGGGDRLHEYGRRL
jgi:hypothetical protein